MQSTIFMRSTTLIPRILAIVFLLLTIKGQTLGQSSDRVAVLTEVKGQVLLARAGSDSFSAGVDFGTALYVDDRVRTGDASSVSVLYSNGDLLTIGANRSITISGESDGTSDGDSRIDVDARASSSAANLTLHRSGDGEIAALSGLRSTGKRASITILAPTNSAVRDASPRFSWVASKEFSLFRVRIFTSNGVVWEGESTSTSLEYPKDAPALATGVDYLWQVFGEDLLDEESSEISKMWVLSHETLSAITEAEANLAALNTESSSGNYHLLLGSLYAETGLLGNAVDEFKALVADYPDSALPHELLAKVFAEMGRMDLAMDALNQASAKSK